MPRRGRRYSSPRPPLRPLRQGVGNPGAFLSSFLCHFLCHFLGALYIFLGQAWAEGEGELQRAACRLIEVEVRTVASKLIVCSSPCSTGRT